MLRVVEKDEQQRQVMTDNIHATGSSDPEILQKHYDNETAALVSTLYLDDLQLLGYPIWDGREDLPQ